MYVRALANASFVLTPAQGNDSDMELPASKDKGKQKRQDIEYKSLSAAQLQETVNDDIRTVASIIGLEVPSPRNRSVAPALTTAH